MKIPLNEKRILNKFYLKNKIPVIYIKDDKNTKPVFSLSVKTGYFNDPIDYPGLAHFLEHLIFMGSKTFPEENYFNEVLSRYQGSTNAYTDSDLTVYYFDSMKDGFEEIINIFYHLITEPLLSKSSQEREVLAVDSEHQKNILNDNWRLFRLLGKLADKEHSFSKFGTGTKETLWKKETIEEVRNFFNKYYICENLNICIVSNENVEYWEEKLNENFGLISNKSELKKIIYSKPHEGIENHDYYLASENNNNKLYLIWNLDFIKKEENPINFINELLVNMGSNSLMKKLIDMNLVKSLDLSVEDERDNYLIIILGLNLTKEGIKHIDLIKKIIKKNLEFLSKENVNELINEYIKKNIIEFDYDENPDSYSLAIKLVETMTKSEDPLFYDYNYKFLNIPSFQKVLNLISIQKPITILIAQNELINNEVLTRKLELNEEYYKMKYYVVDFKETKLNIDDLEFSIPERNKYIEEPILISKKKFDLNIYNNNFSRFDSEWNTPNQYNSVFINFPFFNDIDNYLNILQSLSIISYQIKEEFFDAINAGYSIKLVPYPHKSLLLLEVSGYNSKVNELTKEILSRLDDLCSVEKYLKLVNIEFKIKLEKYKTLPPLSLGFQFIKKQILPNFYTDEELLKNYKELSLEKYKEIINKIIKSEKFFYVYGNYKDLLKSKLTFSIKHKKNKLLKSGEIEHPNKKEKNNGYMKMYYMGENNIKTESIIILLNSLMEQDFFDILRTKHQLGYLVSQKIVSINNEIFLIQKIQTQKDLKLVDKLVNDFNKDFREKLKTINLEEFKESLIKDLLKPKSEMSERYYEDLNEILTGKLIFDRKEKLADEIKKIDLGILKSFYDKNILSGKHNKIFIH